MRFKVSRTSDWFGSENKPCDGAIKKEFQIIDLRTCTEESFDKRFSPKWRDEGRDHSITEKGCISRVIGTELSWSIEINSLDNLMEFIDKNGEIVIDKESIEIYDGYRE